MRRAALLALQAAPDRQRRLGVVKRVEMQTWHTVVEQGLTEVRHNIRTKRAKRLLVIGISIPLA